MIVRRHRERHRKVDAIRRHEKPRVFHHAGPRDLMNQECSWSRDDQSSGQDRGLPLDQAVTRHDAECILFIPLGRLARIVVPRRSRCVTVRHSDQPREGHRGWRRSPSACCYRYRDRVVTEDRNMSEIPHPRVTVRSQTRFRKPGLPSSRFSAPRSCSAALRVLLTMKKRTAHSWR